MKQKLVDVWFQVIENLLANLPGIVGLVAAVGIFALAGAVLSKDRTPILMTLRGWAFATMLAMTLPLIGIRSLTVMLVFMGGMAATGIWRLRGRPIETRGLIQSLVLGAPLIVLSAAAPSIFWDSYAHWLPNAQYLVQANQLISAPLPPAFYSMHPTYPPALAVPIYVASRLTGQFAIGAAETLSSVILVLTVQQFVVAVQQDGRQQVVGANRTWATTLVALMALCLANPAVHNFSYWPANQGLHYWSAISDPIMAVVILSMLLVVATHLSPADTTHGNVAVRHPIQMSTLLSFGILITALKQGGWVLVSVVVIASAIVVGVAGLSRKRSMATLACLVAGSAAASAVWQLYLTRFLPITDQFAVGTLQEWRFDLLPALLNASWAVVQQHQIFYLLVLLAVALGCYALVAKRRRPLTTLDTMMAICGIAFIGHIATLIMAYLGTGFEEWGIRSASSWQRYASQLGFSCCAAVLLLVLLRLSAIRLPVALSGTRSYLLITTVAVLAYLPVAASAVGTLRYFDRYRDESRRLALAALTEIPAQSRLAVMGELWSTNFLLYSAWAEIPVALRPRLQAFHRVRAYDEVPEAVRVIARWTSDPAIDCILVLDLADFAPSIGLPATPDHIRCGSDAQWRGLELGRRDLDELNY